MSMRVSLCLWVLKCIFLLFQGKTMRLASQRQAKPGNTHIRLCPDTPTHTHTHRCRSHTSVCLSVCRDQVYQRWRCVQIITVSLRHRWRSASRSRCLWATWWSWHGPRPTCSGGRWEVIALSHTHTHTYRSVSVHRRTSYQQAPQQALWHTVTVKYIWAAEYQHERWISGHCFEYENIYETFKNNNSNAKIMQVLVWFKHIEL